MKKMRLREFQLLVQWSSSCLVEPNILKANAESEGGNAHLLSTYCVPDAFLTWTSSLTWLVDIVEPQMSEETKVQRGWLLPRNTRRVSGGIRILPCVWCPGNQWATLPSLHFRPSQELLLLPVSLADASRRLWLWTQLSIQATLDCSHSLCVDSHPQWGPRFCYFGAAFLDWVTLLLSFGETEADKEWFKLVIGQLTAKLASYICVMAEKGWLCTHIALVQILWPWESPSNLLNLSFLICKMGSKYLPPRAVGDNV